MRKRVNWVRILELQDNQYMFKYFFTLLGKCKPGIKRGHHLSNNRCAYYTLKHYYSTTTIAELCEKLGI